MLKRRNIGLPPGTALYTGQKTDLPIRINYIQFTEEEYREDTDQNAEDVELHPSNLNIVQWYDIRGLHDELLIKKIGDIFSMHPIALEDAIDVNQRPVFTEYDNSAFLSFKSVSFDDETLKMGAQNVALYFGEGFLISFQENEDDLFVELRKRIKNPNARIRQKKSDYLAYAIVDMHVDRYFVIIEKIAQKIESLEEDINLRPETVDKGRIFSLRKELLKIRKTLSPLREALMQFNRSDLAVMDEKTTAFLRDVIDHTIQLVDTLDNQRDVLSGLQDLYISEISLKMNHVMQFLTIITAIFVPISFLTGLYGMNFEYIPELQMHNGYFVLWAVMLTIVIALVIYFKRNKWL